MKRTGRFVAILCLCAAGLWTGGARADVQAGVDAYNAGDYKRAIDEWMPAAAKNDPDALFNLGQVYRLGKGVKPDLKVAEQYYQRAANLGHVVAQANLGALYLDRKSPLFDPDKGVTWLKKASYAGNALSRYMLGVVYFNGEYVTEDYIEAYAWISLSAQQGVPDAIKAEQTVVSQMSLQQISAGKLRAEAIDKQTQDNLTAAAEAQKAKPAEASKPTKTAEAGATKPAKPWVDPDKRPAPEAETAAPAVSTPAPQPTAAADVPVSGFGIQVASLRSEDSARATWKKLLAAHPDLLGDLNIHIERADLGEKGVYYRLQAGSLASLDEARALCGKLKDVKVGCLPISR
jgi:cell division septation protein DedD